jgi:phage terminase large subunit GpA-like protein
MTETAVLEDLGRLTRGRYRPPPPLTVSEWSDANRVLSPESSASPGKWRTLPYMKSIQDAITDPDVATIVFQKGSQLGATEALISMLLFQLDTDPGPIMTLLPTLDLAASFSRDRLAPAIRDCAAVAKLIGKPRGRDADNSVFRKSAGGAILTISGANSPASLSSRPVRFLLCDETDRYPAATAEGDPLSLAIRRTTAFKRAKVVIASTPTIKGASRIESWYDISDGNEYHMPCARCGELSVYEWEQVRWDHDAPGAPWLVCRLCEGRIEDTERPAMVAAGKWIPSRPFNGIRGYRAWEIVAPWRRLSDIVSSFLTAKTSLESRQVWTNTCLGRTWEPPTEGGSTDVSALLLRREDYAHDGVLPEGVKILTAGVDTQDDRLVFSIWGFGAGEESWIIDHDAIAYDPAKPEAWSALDEVLEREYPHASGGSMRVQCCLVDSAGHRTQSVYDSVIKRQSRRVFACIGRNGGEKGMIVSPAHPVRPRNGSGTVLLRVFDSAQTTSLIMNRLAVAEVGPEYVHLGRHVADEVYLQELTAERLTTIRNKWGIPTRVWQQIRDRNEALDTAKMALAALRIVAPNAAAFSRLAAAITTTGGLRS